MPASPPGPGLEYGMVPVPPSPAPRGPLHRRSRGETPGGTVLTAELGRQDRRLQQDEEQPHAGTGQWVPRHGTARLAARQRQAELGRAEPGHCRRREGVARGRFRTPGPSQQKQERTLAGGEAKGSGATPRRGTDKVLPAALPSRLPDLAQNLRAPRSPCPPHHGRGSETQTAGILVTVTG